MVERCGARGGVFSYFYFTLRCALRGRAMRPFLAGCSEWPSWERLFGGSLSGSDSRARLRWAVALREARLGSAASIMARFSGRRLRLLLLVPFNR